MKLTNATAKEKEEAPDWWNTRPGKAIQTLWQQGLVYYMNYHEAEIEHLVFNEELVKKVIQHVSVLDAQWKGFPKDSFNPRKYLAHKVLHQQIQERFDALEAEAREKREKEAAAAQAQKEEEDADSEPDEPQEKEEVPSKKRNMQLRNRGSDAKSADSNPKKRFKVQHDEKTPDSAQWKQSQIDQGPSGQVIYKKPEQSLEEIWNIYLQKKREYKQWKKVYEDHRAKCLWTKTPPSTDAEN